MTLGGGSPRGPVRMLADAGVGTAVEVLRAMHAGYGDPAFAPPPLMTQYAQAGLSPLDPGSGPAVARGVRRARTWARGRLAAFPGRGPAARAGLAAPGPQGGTGRPPAATTRRSGSGHPR